MVNIWALGRWQSFSKQVSWSIDGEDEKRRLRRNGFQKNRLVRSFVRSPRYESFVSAHPSFIEMAAHSSERGCAGTLIKPLTFMPDDDKSNVTINEGDGRIAIRERLGWHGDRLKNQTTQMLQPKDMNENMSQQLEVKWKKLERYITWKCCLLSLWLGNE